MEFFLVIDEYALAHPICWKLNGLFKVPVFTGHLLFVLVSVVWAS